MRKWLKLILVVTMLAGLTVSVLAENMVPEITDEQVEEGFQPAELEEFTEQSVSEESEILQKSIGTAAESWDIGIDGSLAAEAGKDYIVTGTTATNTITVPNGYNGTITLDGLSGTSISLGAGSNVAIVLQGNNSFTPTVYAETAVGVGGILTISGSGSLTVNPIQNGSSIYVPKGSTLIINEGTIVANGSNHAAGIGGKRNGSAGVGTIIINGGSVTANGGGRWSGCAGIGTGIPNPGNDTNSTGGTIIINGGTVNATGGYSDGSSGIGGAGIGMGKVAAGGTNLVQGQKIIITGGNITASGGLTASAIGAGSNSAVKTDSVVILPGANIVELTSDNAPLIGNASKIFYLNSTEINGIGSDETDTVPFIVKAVDASVSLEAFADFTAYDGIFSGVGAFSLGMSAADTPSGQVWDLEYYNDIASSGTGNVVLSADGYEDKLIPVDDVEMDGGAFVYVLGGELPSGDITDGTITISVTYGEETEICTTATGITDVDTVFKLEYDANKLELQNIAAQRFEPVLTAGTYGNITVHAVSDGEVVFGVIMDIAPGKSWSGLLSIFKFMPKTTGDVVVTISAL